MTYKKKIKKINVCVVNIPPCTNIIDIPVLVYEQTGLKCSVTVNGTKGYIHNIVISVECYSHKVEINTSEIRDGLKLGLVSDMEYFGKFPDKEVCF